MNEDTSWYVAYGWNPGCTRRRKGWQEAATLGSQDARASARYARAGAGVQVRVQVCARVRACAEEARACVRRGVVGTYCFVPSALHRCEGECGAVALDVAGRLPVHAPRRPILRDCGSRQLLQRHYGDLRAREGARRRVAVAAEDEHLEARRKGRAVGNEGAGPRHVITDAAALHPRAPAVRRLGVDGRLHVGAREVRVPRDVDVVHSHRLDAERAVARRRDPHIVPACISKITIASKLNKLIAQAVAVRRRLEGLAARRNKLLISPTRRQLVAVHDLAEHEALDVGEGAVDAVRRGRQREDGVVHREAL